ncbi:rodlin [Streptomyces sp. DH8]|uniref:rodlin n=1 Tax=Streptomyces sp. DH8 TaxID=2857008 RepID=UPI001E34231C|nr:rodlin [Streptomyces sp. DH8]
MMAGAAVAVSLLGLSAAAAPTAMAIGNDGGTTTLNGNDAESEIGNAETEGDFSPQSRLVQGTLNKLCVGLLLKANVGSLVGIVPIVVQDVNVLSHPQDQQCTHNSTQAKGDEPLSPTLDDIPVLSGNGVGNN